MNSTKKLTKMLAVALSLSLLLTGVVLTASAGEGDMMAENDRIIKPIKNGLETSCTYNEYDDVWSCRL